MAPRIEASDELAPIYSAEEDEQLARNLAALLTEIHQGLHRRHPLTLAYLCEIHAKLFEGVRTHGGRYRTHGRGSETLVFGPNRSVHREQVERELEAVLRQAQDSILSVEANPDDPDRDRSALHIAVWTHAELVRIHPFEDGNGRTSRNVMSSILVRLGLRPIAVEECKQTYCDCLNEYFRSRNLKPLLHLMLRLMAEQLAD